MAGNSPDWNDYHRTCMEQGMPPEMATFFANGIMAARERQAKGEPGWEHIVARAPASIRRRAQAMYRFTDQTNPSRDEHHRFDANVQAVMSFGVLVGMMLAEAGHGPNATELEAVGSNMRDVWEWVANLDSEETTG